MTIDEYLNLEHGNLAQVCLNKYFENKSLKDSLEKAQQEIKLYRDLLFARRSEKDIVLPDGCMQNTLFGVDVKAEPVVPSEPIAPVPACAEDAKPKEKSKRGPNGRSVIPENLEVVVRKVALDESVPRTTTDGTTLKLETLFEERVDLIPRKLIKLIIERETLIDPRSGKEVCRACGDNEIIDNGIFATNAILELAMQKYGQGMPIERQVQELAQMGMKLAPNTIAGNITSAAMCAEPVIAAMQQQILQEHLIHMDETPMDQLTAAGRKPKNIEPNTTHDEEKQIPESPPPDPTKKDGVSEAKKPAIRQCQIFAMHGGGQVYYQFSQTRSQNEVYRLLGFDVDDPKFSREGLKASGAVKVALCDGYIGYDMLQTLGIIRAGCWVHARRKFVPLAINGNPHAKLIVQIIGKLFHIEKTTNEKLETKCLTKPEELAFTLNIRTTHSTPIIANLKTTLDAYALADTSPNSEFRKAVQYCLNFWSELTVFLTDPTVPLDNNSTERGIRPIAVGRNAYYFMGSERGGKNAAIFYSLIESCRMLKIDTRLYLQTLFHALGEVDPRRRQKPENLTPKAMAPAIRVMMKEHRKPN